MTASLNKDLLPLIHASYLWSTDEESSNNVVKDVTMTACLNKDLLPTVQSSYLWGANEQSPNDVLTQDLNTSNGLSQATSPHFSTINVPTKEPTATSLSDMHFKSTDIEKSRRRWTPSILVQENSQVPLVEAPSKSSRFALLAKSGNPICQCRMTTIVFVSLILALFALAIGIPLGLGFRSPDPTTTSTTTTTTISTSTTSTTSTTTTPPATLWIPTNYNVSCLATCISVSTVTPSTLLASWPFEQNVIDVSGNREDGEIINGAAFNTGYIGQAIELRNSSGQFVSAPDISLSNRSFTVEVWINMYTLKVNGDLSIFTQCEISLVDRCLHYVIRGSRAYLGFFSDDVMGGTNLSTSVWYHLAFVYDYSLNIKTVYLNGLSDGSSTASGVGASKGAFLGTIGNATIGAWANSALSNWDGLLDQLTVTNRAKTPCEVLNDASLVAHFPFDGSFNDIGPNSMLGTFNPQANNGLSWGTGQVNQALYFHSSNAYFQSCGFYALGRNQPYSIAMWVKPSSQSGTLFHISSAATGSGAWCLPMIGFSSNGSIVVQTWIGSIISIMGPILPINISSHIVQTYSSTNGLRLYINGGLYGSAAANRFSSSNLVMCILLGSSGLGTNCQTQSISMGPYSGAIDEFYVYNRELNDLEVCPLAHP